MARDIIEHGPKKGRQRCCVVGCRRTFKDEGYSAQICGAHWRMGSKAMRDECRVIEKAAKRSGWTNERLDRHHALFAAIVDQATEKSVGL